MNPWLLAMGVIMCLAGAGFLACLTWILVGSRRGRHQVVREAERITREAARLP